jgi:copper chaperone NosL
MKSLSRAPRVLVAAAALLLGALYVTPLWSIRLIAPQYPEGLGLIIRLSTITGAKEHDLQSINSLNHYIGMRAIEPDAIPELRLMPWIVAGLIAFGLMAALMGRRRVLVAWVATFAAAGVGGMYDFWRWGYDYGHNLDAGQAIIVVPGMTYQPPLLGSKQLLNFTATSWPALGGWIAGVALLCAATAVYLAFAGQIKRRAVTAGALATSMACAAPAPMIHFGTDLCAECHMVIADQRFGAVLVTTTGKTLTFDSIECMRAHRAKTGDERLRQTMVVVASAPGALVAESEARLVSDGELRPPMGNTYALAR